MTAATGEVPTEVAGAAPAPSEVDRLIEVVFAGFVFLALLTYTGSTIRNGDVDIRVLLLWAMAGTGVVLLGRLAWQGDAAARWAAGFVVWSAVCMLVSGRIRQSFHMGIGTDNGWSLVCGYLGVWAVGRSRRGGGGRLVVGAFLGGAVLNVVVGLLQFGLQDERGLFSWGFERPFGVLGNPVMFGGVMTGALAFSGAWLARSGARWWWWLGPIGLFAAAVNLSGSRVALLGALVLAPLAARRGGWRRALAVAAVVVVAYAATWNAIPSGAGERLSGTDGGSSGVTARLEMWNAARQAVAERPIVGYGPGRFGPATFPWITSKYVEAESAQTVYLSAHNVAIETLTTTGVVGLVLAGGFAWCAARRARGPWAWLAFGISVTWLLEPVSVFTAPLALLALGFAGAERAPPTDAAADAVETEPAGPPAARMPRVLLACAVVLSLVGGYAGVRLVLADRYLSRALDTGGTEQIDDLLRARDMWPGDVPVADAITNGRAYVASIDRRPEDQHRMLQAAHDLVDLDPDRFDGWLKLARLQSAQEMPPTPANERLVRRYLIRAYEIDGWFVPILKALYDVDVAAGRTADAEHWRERLCILGECPAPAP